MRILSIVHTDSDPPGLFAQVADERDHHHDEWRIDLHAEPPASLDSYATVAIFGGYMDPGDDDRLSWLRTEKGLLRGLVERGVPAIGICLGAQLLAEAAGAEVARADPPEIGWSEVEVLPEANGDPLFGRLGTSITGFEWHSWTFGLPSGAIPLARSRTFLQAYRLPPSTWGIQFHAEVTPDKLSEWLDHAATDPVGRVGVDPARERDVSRRHLPASMAVGRTLFTRFLDHVARTADPERRPDDRGEHPDSLRG